jgi:putative tryptophan/tyrosine transport system substrate-binding protein
LSELIQVGPEVIVRQDTPLTLAAKRDTKEIPIVGAFIADPVGFGLVASTAHPGGNVTGLFSGIDRLTSKQLELLLQVVPSATRVGVMISANNPANVLGARLLQSDKAALRIQLFPAELGLSTEIDPAFQAFAGEHIDAVLVFQDSLFSNNEARIAALALAARLPTVFDFREHVSSGRVDELWPQPEPPVARGRVCRKNSKRRQNRPTSQWRCSPNLELVINLKTAKTLGITIPPSVMAFANDVIE